MNLKDLDPTLQAKVETCSTPEEILALAKEEGYALTDDDLEQISGGGFWDSPTCPHCGSGNIAEGEYPTFRCLNCGQVFQP